MDRRILAGGVGVAASCLTACLIVDACGTTTVIGGPPDARSATPAPTSPFPTPSAAPACTATHLAVSTAGTTTAEGSTELMVKIENQGPAACLLVGYPQVVGHLESGAPVRGSETAHVLLGMANPDAGASQVTLAPADAAWLPLNFPGTPAGDAASCPAFTSITITPPGVARTFTLSPRLDESGPESGTAVASDCAGIQVPPVLSAADAVVPPPGSPS